MTHEPHTTPDTPPITAPGHRTDVAVVGAGLAGLVAAASAARAGARVTIVDGRAAGGRARSTDRGGLTLNEGAHALYARGPALGASPSSASRCRGPATPRHVPDGVGRRSSHCRRARRRSPRPGSFRHARRSSSPGWIAGAHRHADRTGDVSVEQWLDDQRANADLRRYVLALMRLGSYAARPESAAAPSPAASTRARRAGGHLRRRWMAVDRRRARDVRGCAGCRDASVYEAVTRVERLAGTWQVATATRTVEAAAVVLATGGPAVAGGPARIGRGGLGRACRSRAAGDRARHRWPRGRARVPLSADEPLYLSTHAPVARLAPAGEHLVTAMRYLAADDDAPVADNRAGRTVRCSRRCRTVNRAHTRTVPRGTGRGVGVADARCPTPVGPRVGRCRRLRGPATGLGDHLLTDAAVASGRAAGLAAAARSRVAA